MNIYVGNLAYGATEDDLRQAFEAYGQVTSTSVIMDKLSGRSRGFGFVEMPVASEAQAAIQALNGAQIKGRAISVNEARPREDRGSGDRGGRGGGFGSRDNRGGNRGGRSERW